MRKQRQLRFVGLVLLTIVIGAFVGQRALRPLWRPPRMPSMTRHNVGEVLEALGPEIRTRLHPVFHDAGVSYPPNELALLGFKEERCLEVWASRDDVWQYVKHYPILGLSGGLGPKLQEGDGQVPEGLYRVEALNPNSRFHLSIRLDYPNAFDREHAMREGRLEPGGDIYIHGGTDSVGCLAVGDPAIEELFVIVAETGMESVRVILAPRDLRQPDANSPDLELPWSDALYDMIQEELNAFTPIPESL